MPPKKVTSTRPVAKQPGQPMGAKSVKPGTTMKKQAAKHAAGKEEKLDSYTRG